MALPQESESCGPLVLIVDDDQTMRMLARASVEGVGMSAVEAQSGEEALEIVDRVQPDLVVLDIMMPGIDGFETCQEIRKRAAHVPVLIMTGLTDLQSIDHAYEAGATDFITKPLNWTVFGHRARYMVRAGQALAELGEARAAAEAANRVKSAFMANMSHEIRTPMTAILGYLDLLGDEELSGSQRREYIRIVNDSGQHLLSILNDILDISKLEAGAMTVERVPVAPHELIRDVASLMRARAAEKGLRFQLSYEGPTPETIHTDPVRLRQILLNLLGNAVKFTKQGEVRLAVGLVDAGEPPTPRLRFDVIDTGVGIAPGEKERLFEPFVQADTSFTRRFGGTGLGLAISKQLAEQLGGSIAVRDNPGGGSIFTADIETGSLEGSRMIDANDGAREARSRGGKSSGVRLVGRVLLAEDGVDNQRLFTRVLRAAGLEVDVAENGRLAVDKALAARDAEAPFDLVLMDMQMPVLDGLDATEELRREGYDGPIIALTAHALESDRERCLRAGCDDFLTKPLDKRRLISVLTQYLSKSDPVPFC
jgi:signal transduction histidine kinase